MKELKGYTAVVVYADRPDMTFLLGKPSSLSPHFGSNGLRLYTNKREFLRDCNKRKKGWDLKKLGHAILEMNIAESMEDLELLKKEKRLVALSYYENEEEGAEFFGRRIDQRGFDSRVDIKENGLRPYISNEKGSAFDQAYHAASEIGRQTGGLKARVATFKLTKIKV